MLALLLAIVAAALFAFTAASPTYAQPMPDIARGNLLYNTWCAGCHGADPRQSQPQLAANRPDVLRDAIALVMQMNFLRAVLAAADITDVAAYIGSVASTGVPVLNPTPGSVAFALQTVGETGAPQTLLLTNLGSNALTITAIAVAPADFAVTGNCIGRRNPNSTCALTLTFAPRAAGPVAGRVTVTIAESGAPVVVPVLGAGTLRADTPLPIVVEYHSPELDHYFITADAGEQRFVDTGAVGTWVRTGNAFRSGGLSQVCRFYGNGNIDPATGSKYGPNSHFYTAGEAECNALKSAYDSRAPSWRFESLDFSTTRLPAGECPAGTVPVYRAYNNGAARKIESNHRMTTNRTAIDQVVARGWVDEGVAMCAPE